MTDSHTQKHDPRLARRRAVVTTLTSYAALTLAYILVSGQLRAMLAWLPAGIAAAFLIRWGRSQWIWVALGTAAAGLAGEQSGFFVIFSALATVAGAFALASYLESSDFRHDFSRRRDVVRFAVAASLAMLLPPTLTILYMNYAGLAPAQQDPLSMWLLWWFNATIGTIAIAPTFVAASRDTIDRCRREPIVAAGLVAATIGFAVLAIAVPSALRTSWLSPIGILIVVVSAIRMDLTFTGALALTMAGAVATALGTAVQVSGGSVPIARVWAFCMILAGLTLTVRALLSERDAAEQRLRDTEVRYRRELIDAARHEQQRLGRDMHDSLGQELTSIALMARNIEMRAGREAPELVSAAHELSRGCARATQAARSIARGLLLPGDLTGDLATALRQLAARVPVSAGVTVTADVEDGLPMSDEVTTSLYRISQEALNNALKHSCATRIRISLARQGEDWARLVIEDDGVGTAALRLDEEGGVGLRTMRYRAELVGGQFACESIPGDGTRVSCTVGICSSNQASAGPAQPALADPDRRPHWTQRRAS